MSRFIERLDRALLQKKLVEKQRLYAQMEKDNITGQVRENLADEIKQILVSLYPQAKPVRS